MQVRTRIVGSLAAALLVGTALTPILPADEAHAEKVCVEVYRDRHGRPKVSKNHKSACKTYAERPSDSDKSPSRPPHKPKPTPTPAPKPPAVCDPRPRVAIHAERDTTPSGLFRDAWVLKISADDRYGSGGNAVQEITVKEIRNLRVTLPGGPHDATKAPFTWRADPARPLSAYREVPISLTREGEGRVFIVLTVKDRCGSWPTFWGAP